MTPTVFHRGKQMDWSRLEVAGRVTALARGYCAGVGADGDAFVVPLRLPYPSVRTYDGLLLDSFGVLGVAQGEQTWLTGRGADGRLHLWSAYADGQHVRAALAGRHRRGVGRAGARRATRSWCSPAHLDGGSWRLRLYPRETAILGGRPTRPPTSPSGTDPDTALAFAFYEQEPLVVAGPLGRLGDTARVVDRPDGP